LSTFLVQNFTGKKIKIFGGIFAYFFGIDYDLYSTKNEGKFIMVKYEIKYRIEAKKQDMPPAKPQGNPGKAKSNKNKGESKCT